MHDISIGFVPLLDSAVLLAAQEKGFFQNEGLTVHLKRETSWSAIRDRLAVGQLQAAHVLGPMPIAANLGLFPLSPSLMAPFALGLGGNWRWATPWQRKVIAAIWTRPGRAKP